MNQNFRWLAGRLAGIAFLTLFIQASAPAQAAGAASAAPVVCATRWDAWYSNGPSDPARYTAITLSKPEWRGRAPLHGKFDSAGNITWAPTQETFDAEIHAAHGANLCWAYLAYGKDNVIDMNNSMMNAFKLHRNSKIKSLVKYALMMATSNIGKADDFKTAVDAAVALMHDENYQHVSVDGVSRPLLFLMIDANDIKTFFGNSLAKAKEPLDSIRETSKAQNLGNPYIVVMASPGKQAELMRKALGGDATSEYVAGRRTGQTETWAQFEPTIEADWNDFASTSSGGVVPSLRSGADIRARCQTPPPYEHRFPPGDKCENYTANPTIDQLKAEFKDALAWMDKNPARDPAHALLVYAWSECDESGNCLMPTYGDPTGEKLRAIGEVLR